MKTMNTKLALSLVLALVLMMTVFALGVFADDTVVEVESGDRKNEILADNDEAGVLTDGAIGEDVALRETNEETPEATEEKGEFFFDPMNFVSNLKYMGTGMLGIFIVIGVIIVAVVVLNKTTAPKKNSEE